MEGDVRNEEGVSMINSEHVLVLVGCDTTFPELLIPVDSDVSDDIGVPLPVLLILVDSDVSDDIGVPFPVLLNPFESVAIYDSYIKQDMYS